MVQELDNLFQWCTTSYAADIAKYMKEKEVNSVIHLQSPQLQYRTVLVNWLRNISERLHLFRVTVHLAVYILDKFMDNHDIPVFRLPSVAIVCLVIAAKFEECESKVPKLSELGELACMTSSLFESPTLYPVSVFAKLEVQILRWLGWSVCDSTPAHFAEYYSLFAVVAGDSDSDFTPHVHLLSLVQGSLYDYLDMSLSEIGLLEFKGSLVGAACLLAARRVHNVSPVWPPSLVSVTGYRHRHLLAPLAYLIKNKSQVCGRKRKLNDSVDTGYESASPNNAITTKRISL